MELYNENQNTNENLSQSERLSLHILMEERLEKILVSIEEKKLKKSKLTFVPRLPANKEKGKWNLSEIPILFGA